MIMPWYSCNLSQPDASEAKPHLPQQHENWHEFCSKDSFQVQPLVSISPWVCEGVSSHSDVASKEGVGIHSSAVRLIPKLRYTMTRFPCGYSLNFLPREILPFPIAQVPHLPCSASQTSCQPWTILHSLNTCRLLASYLHRTKSFW